MQLRLAISNHIEDGLMPVLSETIQPTGGRDWTPQHAAMESESVGENEERPDFRENDSEFELTGDGPDEGLQDDDLDQIMD